MPFKEWISIENHYLNNYINSFMERYGGELNKEHFIITEKIDGSNLSVIFYPEGKWQFAKRSGIIDSDDNFYDYKSVFQTKEIKEFLEIISNYCIKNKKTLQFVGELFGQGVQKRVYYGAEKYWNWYAIYEFKNDEIKILSYDEEADFISEISYNDYPKEEIIANLYVPIVSNVVVGLEKALEVDIIRNSLLTPYGYDKENLMEGVVIRPIDKNYWINDNSMLIIKKKNPNFDDKNKVKKERIKFNVSENLQSLYDKTIGYVNENRTADLFSKCGKIPAITHLGKYIGFYAKDIYEDIMRNYPIDFENLEKKEQQWLMKQFIPETKKELIKWL